MTTKSKKPASRPGSKASGPAIPPITEKTTSQFGFSAPLDADVFAEEDLAKSGLTMEDAKTLDMEGEIIQIGPEWWPDWGGPGLRMIYREPLTDTPMADQDGKAYFRRRAYGAIRDGMPKYRQKAGSSVRAYFARNLLIGWSKVVEDPSEDIIITEGEKKGAKGCKEGFATIALGGIWSFKSGPIRLITDLDRIRWTGRRVTLVYDSDPPTASNAKAKRKELERARQTLANELIARGAEVHFVDLPLIADDRKTGLDDFLVAHGGKALRSLLKSAPKMEKVDLKVSLDLDEVIDRMNERYLVVNEAGNVVVYQPGFDQVLGRRHITSLSFDALRNLYLNKLVVIGYDANNKPITKTWANAWLVHQERREYPGGVVFDPSGKSPTDVYNLWQGFHVQPSEGDWSLMRDHIEKIICAGNEEHFEYLLNWLALMFQKPAKQGKVAVVMKGKKGAGKGIFANAVNHIMGQHGMTISSSKHLVGNFNSHLRDCIFLFADEAFFAGDKANLGALKSYITEPCIAVEGKYKTPVTAPNYLHILMASNEEWVVPASTDERRFFMPEVSGARVGDFDYFEKMQRQLDTGGYEAMLYELLHRDISNFNVAAVPATKGLEEQKKLSLPTPEAWWMECLTRGWVHISKAGAEEFSGGWVEQVSTDILFASYKAFANEAKDRHPISREAFGKFMSQMGAQPRRLNRALVSESSTMIVRGERPHGYALGTLERARMDFCGVTKLDMTWPEEDAPRADEAAPAGPKRSGRTAKF